MLASVSLTLKHAENSDGVEQIDVKQVATGGIENSEQHILDWTVRPHVDKVFGAMQVKGRRIKIEDLEQDYLKADWLTDVQKHGIINMQAENDKSKSGRVWTIMQVWGFAEIHGERRLVRRAYGIGASSEVVECRFIYDYVGPIES